jgi:multiple sugar transport system permease protein
MRRYLFDRLSVRQRQAFWAWTFLAVPIVFFVSIRFYPTFNAVYISLTDWNLLGEMKFVGPANYAELLYDPEFWQVFSNTFE